MSQDFRRIGTQRRASDVLPLRLLVHSQLPLALTRYVGRATMHSVSRILDVTLPVNRAQVIYSPKAAMSPVGITTPVSRASLTDSVYETLVEAIIAGQLEPGTELNSVALAQQLDVSRTPVKEAIRLLVRDGLANQTNNFKARVVKFSRDDVRETYEVRSLLEAAAAERAATRIPDEVLQDLQRQARQLRTTQKDLDWAARALEFDLRLHAAIAEAAGNQRLQADIERYRLLVRSFCRMTGRPTVLKQAFEEHIAILDALATGRPALARKAMASHIASRLAAVLEEHAHSLARRACIENGRA